VPGSEPSAGRTPLGLSERQIQKGLAPPCNEAPQALLRVAGAVSGTRGGAFSTLPKSASTRGCTSASCAADFQPGPVTCSSEPSPSTGRYKKLQCALPAKRSGAMLLAFLKRIGVGSSSKGLAGTPLKPIEEVKIGANGPARSSRNRSPCCTRSYIGVVEGITWVRLPYNNRFNLPKRGCHALCSVDQKRSVLRQRPRQSPTVSVLSRPATVGRSFAG
jgi:hypothetical protein